VLLDPDWNPAVDKQAAARCWRDGQKKRCFTYRFLATGTVEEKIFQRQLSKEGLQSVVDDKEQVNALSTKDLSNLFKLRSGTPSDTHDKLRCERCQIIHDNAEIEATKVLPKKLAACRELLNELREQEDSKYFLKPFVPTEYGVTKEEYEKVVKQPMDVETILGKLDRPPEHNSAYCSVPPFCKDVNRTFSNVLKIWSPGDEVADAARRLQGWWIEKWTDIVPTLMAMTASDDGESHKTEEDTDLVDAALESSATTHTERGDDYQEQIGMPDEENMRHWSHHHSAGTVDDPVFRAAMRGLDSVSFVFGLEVTWSLIQQRQQEEEERIAMQELDKMQVEELDDDADQPDADVAKLDKKSAAVATKPSDTAGDLSNSDSDDDNDSVGSVKDFIVQEDDANEGDSSDDEDAVPEDENGGDSSDDQSAGDDNEGQNGSPASALVESPSSSSLDSVAKAAGDDEGQQDSPASVLADSPGCSSDESVDKSASDDEEVLVDSPDTFSVESTAMQSDKSEVMDSLALVANQPSSVSARLTPYAEAEIADTSPGSAIEAQVYHSDTRASSLSGTQDTDASSRSDPENSSISVAPSNEWACSSCTLLNKKSRRKCRVCTTVKPPQQIKATKKRSRTHLSK